MCCVCFSQNVFFDPHGGREAERADGPILKMRKLRLSKVK